MKITKNILLKGLHQKPILTDAYYQENGLKKPLILFAHGYKGYKDWGCWDLVARAFANAGFFFVKFNFSHNGGTPEQPIDFPDLEAFGNNNYSKELDDLQSVIDWLHEPSELQKEMDLDTLALIGHSRGGGIVSLKASEEPRVHKLISWAAVSNFGNRSSTIGDLENWKTTGVKYVINGRTKQEMPHFYQFYEDYKRHETRLNIELAVKKISIPHLIIHGTKDSSILFKEAKDLHSWNPKSQLLEVSDANHTFGSKHPWEETRLPVHLQEVVERSIQFCLETTNGGI